MSAQQPRQGKADELDMLGVDRHLVTAALRHCKITLVCFPLEQLLKYTLENDGRL